MCSFKDNGVFFYLLLFFYLVTSSLVSDKDIIRRVIQKQSTREFQLNSRKHKHESSKQKLDISFKLEQTEARIPKTFDAREKWPMCKSLQKIRNHEMCGAGWAFAAAATISDRLCIQSNGTINIDLSAEELISCCTDCGGCSIGNSTRAWQFWVNKGLVSGGDYDGSSEGCKPYSEATARDRKIPSCKKQCQSDYNTTYQEDKYFGESFYTIRGNISQIQIDIMTSGPVQAGLEVHEDFFIHKRGVYRHKPASKYIGYTHVKILGWGMERNTPYWLAVTSWGSEFGYFKILRGKNEVGIEANVIAGRPQIFHSSSPSTTSTTTSQICFYSIRSISKMLKVSWWAFIVTIGSISFSFFSMKKRVNFYEKFS